MSSNPLAKNVLQEYYQSFNLKLPVCIIYRISGSSHNPLFKSELELRDGKKFQSLAPTKKRAELNVANLANIYLGLTKEDIDSATNTRQIEINNFNFSKNENYCDVLFIDLENQQSDIKSFLNIDNVKVFGFTHEKHPILKSNLYNMKVFTTNSECKDASDILMCVLITEIYNKSSINETNNCFVVTADHFGGALRDILTEKYHREFKWIKCYGDYLT